MILNLTELAKLLKLSPRRIQQLVNEGVIIKDSHGKYEGPQSIQNYIQNCLNVVKKKTEPKEPDVVDYAQERALHERAKRVKAELDLAIIENSLHRADDVRAVMGDMLIAFRSKMLAIPSKLAPQLAGQTDIPVIMDAITKEVHEALNELSAYNPAEFQTDERIADEEAS